MVLNKYANIFLSMALVTVVSTVILYSLDNYRSFIMNNQLLAERSVISTAREIEFFINERKRYISLFADQEKELLSNLIYNPSNSGAHQKLEEKINTYFPNRFSFTIAQADGNPLLAQDAELIGGTCRKDIHLFLQNNKRHMVYVHSSPNTSRLHFDVMTSIMHNTNVPSVLFVSFFLDDVFRLVEHGTIKGHHLFLVNRGNPSVIEATTSGALDIYREYGHTFTTTLAPKKSSMRYIWPDSLNKKVISTHRVKGTRWELMDVMEPEMVQGYVTRLLYQGSGILLLFFIVTLAGFWLTKRLGILSGDTRSILDSVENERRRVAMDLHDEVLSDISHLRRDCQKVNKQNSITVLKQTADNIDNELEQITNTIRHIIDDLHPQSIEILGLAETIRSYCRKHYEQQTMNVNLMINNWDEMRLSQAEKLNIFRVFQEVIHNASRHADATQCDVTLHMTQQKLALCVDDNGIGFSTTNAKQSHGRGMKNITARARTIHAKAIWTTQSKGTMFLLELPLCA